tara:strand:- start:245 stop:430 length:186 start_codon:yes stop_codon:yes gene_type:complete
MVLDLIKNDLEDSARTIRLYGNMVASMSWGNNAERTYILDGIKYIVLKELGIVKEITKINK